MARAELRIEGFISNDLTYRDAGTHRVVTVSVPVTPSKKDESGNWINEDDKTVWYEAEFWNEHADVLTQQVQKKSLVILTGVPELQVFSKRDGTPGAKIKLANPTIAAVVRRPSRGGENRGGGQGAPTQESWASAAPGGSGASQGDVWNAPEQGGFGFEDSTPF